VLRLTGAALTTLSAVVFLVVFAADLFGLHTNPYLGVVFFLVLPALFVLGLLLFAFGHWPGSWPHIDLNNSTHRTAFFIVLLLTFVNVIIVSMAAYRGVEYVDSVGFCGQVCHTVMQPEFAAHETGSHANVKCIDCHAGPGAMSFVSAKASGTRRVLAVMRGRYETPIVPEPRQLPTSKETCEQCHSSARFSGERINRVIEYADNEKNAPAETKIKFDLRKVHTHMDKGIEFAATDKTRQTIPYVRVKNADGSWREYQTKDAKAGAALRRMDCTDCHNRPSHTFRLPEQEVDHAMTAGAISRDLPFVRREGIRLLKAEYPSREAAQKGIADGLQAFYAREHPQIATARAAAIRNAATTLGAIYRANVFPSMKVGWGTYPNHLGHENSPGCFRCHDDAHKQTTGDTITQDCSTCHELIAVEEKDPEILKQLGMQ